MQNKRVLLIIGGGIAAYKALDLIRKLKQNGVSVRVILTRAGAKFVTPLSLATLSGEPVEDDLFDAGKEAEIGHIRLSRDADLVVVAPATADLLAKMANGLADDLATTCLLATDKPVLAVPAMNVRMWRHPATERNVAQLHRDGVRFVGPETGEMACGEYGPGRMAEVTEIIKAIALNLSELHDEPLLGRHVLITAGPTYEPIDPVRFIGNRSSGKQGYALAAAAARLGADVTLVSGPTGLKAPSNVKTIHVETAREMLAAVQAALPADIAILAAAVADWRVNGTAKQKIKKLRGGEPPLLEFVENPDILKTISKPGPKRPPLVIGFAAETEHVIANAQKKRQAKGCDWIVANDVSEAGGAMGGEKNTVHLITSSKSKPESWPEMTKAEVADKLLRRAADLLARKAPIMTAAKAQKAKS